MSKTTRPKGFGAPPAARRLDMRRARTTLADYDPDLPQVDLVADDSLNDLAAPRGQLIKRLFPKISKLHVLTTAAGSSNAQLAKFFVTHAGAKGTVGDVVTIAPRADIEAMHANLEKVRSSALNAAKIVPATRPPVYEGELGAMALRGVLVSGQLAPTFLDELKSTLLEASPGLSLVGMPRQIWKRGSPLHELAVETATRDTSFLLGGPSGLARQALKQIVDGLVALMPAQLTEASSASPAAAPAAADPVDVGDGKATAEANDGPLSLASATEMGADVQAGEAEEVAEEVAEEEEDFPTEQELLREAREAFKARCSPKLLALLEHLGPNGTGAKWAASLDEYQQGFFGGYSSDLMTDTACAPLITCLTALKALASPTWRSSLTLLPVWVDGWHPLQVQCHGQLRASNLLVDADRRLHYVGLRHPCVAPLFTDVARLISHCLVACVKVDAAYDTTGAGTTGVAETTGDPGTVGTEGAVANSPERSSVTTAEDRLSMLCSAIDVLLPASMTSCCYDSLLVISSLPVADLVKEGTPEDIKAVTLIAQQLIESACKTTLAASGVLGKVDEHDLHPINLLLPLLHCSISLCGSRELTHNQQRVAWHMTLRAASLVAEFLGAGDDPAQNSGGSDAAMARELKAARKELEDVRREAAAALQLHKALVERLESELLQLKTPSGAKSTAKGASSQATGTVAGAPAASKEGAVKGAGTGTPGKKKKAAAKTSRPGGGRNVDFAVA